MAHKFEHISTGNGFSVLNNGVTTPVISQTGAVRPTSIFGNTYFVDYASGLDTNAGTSPTSAFKTLSAAYNACTTNNNDVIFIDGYSTVVETAMITWAKNRITVIGVGGGVKYGQGAKISMGVTAAATDLGVMLVTGVRNTFRNLKFMSSNTKAESLYCVLESGEYSVYENCEFYKSTDLDETTAAELVLNGDSAQFYNCTFGSLADFQTGTTIRPNVKLAKGTATSGTGVMRECYFEGCRFLKNSGHTTSAMIYATASADVERSLELVNCTFINAKNSAAVPAQAVASAASLTAGGIYLHNCGAFNVTKVSTSTGVLISSAAGAATGGLAAQAA